MLQRNAVQRQIALGAERLRSELAAVFECCVIVGDQAGCQRSGMVGLSRELLEADVDVVQRGVERRFRHGIVEMHDAFPQSDVARLKYEWLGCRRSDRGFFRWRGGCRQQLCQIELAAVIARHIEFRCVDGQAFEFDMAAEDVGVIDYGTEPIEAQQGIAGLHYAQFAQAGTAANDHRG
ncbi:hypothetical protein GALL_538070 [mine drainage metagenome]|uniref:Uncharacterized protein n=1 Tax=mine drainage metagenome TaxID=410659 RepID=A0A1J5NZE6_9ZZZZ